MKRALSGLVGMLLISAVASAGCGTSGSTSTTEIATTVSITTTTTEAPATWRQIEPVGVSPVARCYQAMVYDSTSRKIIMFGGSDGVTTLEETWSYEPLSSKWTKLGPEGEGQPAAARQMAGAYDPTSLSVVTFDGTSWGYDVRANAWDALSPKGDRLSPARYGANIVLDAKSGRIILFGGTDMNESYDETWAYDPRDNTWTELEIEGEIPPGRSDAGMVYEPVAGKVVLFGGVDSDFNCLDDTWLFDSDSNAWTELTTAEAPSARSGLAMAFDRHSSKVVLFGGIDSQLVCYNDVWSLDLQGATWSEATPTGTMPYARGRVSMVYVPALDGLVVFGGVTVQGDDSGGFGALAYLDDMWVYGVESQAEVGPEGGGAAAGVTTTTLSTGSSATTTTSE